MAWWEASRSSKSSAVGRLFAFGRPFKHLMRMELLEKREQSLSGFWQQSFKGLHSTFTHCTSLLQVGDLISSMALSVYGLISIPLWLTMKTMNFHEFTPKAHLEGLIQTLWRRPRKGPFQAPLMFESYHWLNQHVVDICLHRIPYHISEQLVNHAFLGGTNIYEPKGNHCILIYIIVRVEGRIQCILFKHLDLVIPRAGVHKA